MLYKDIPVRLFQSDVDPGRIKGIVAKVGGVEVSLNAPQRQLIVFGKDNARLQVLENAGIIDFFHFIDRYNT